MVDASAGVLLDEEGHPLAGLPVVASWTDPLAPRAVTGPDGTFRFAEGVPPRLVALDPLGLRPLPTTPGARPGEWRVRRADAYGWRAAEGDPLVEGQDVEALVDDAMFDAFADAVARARRTLHLVQLLFFPDFRARFGSNGASSALVESVREAAARGAQVRILLNENAVIPDTAKELRAVFREDGVEVRSLLVYPNALHAKLMVVDGAEGFLIGPPFQQKFWDTPAHLAEEPRRGHARPNHDVSIRLRGPAVAGIDATFAALWNRAAPPGAPELAPTRPPKAAGNVGVQLVRTLPQGILPEAPAGERGILESYLRALANAQEYVYLETQYFTNPTLVTAIDRALQRNPRLQVIVVVNEWTDIPGYVAWQRRHLAALGSPERARLGVFCLRTQGEGQEGIPIYVHSKVGFADDAWCTLGSANLDSISLQRAGEFGVEVEANVELNVNVFDGIEGQPRSGFVAALRRQLWAEHLGDGGVWATDAPGEGWLALWQEAAARNLLALRDGARMPRGHALPYPVHEAAHAPEEFLPRRILEGA